MLGEFYKLQPLSKQSYVNERVQICGQNIIVVNAFVSIPVSRL